MTTQKDLTLNLFVTDTSCSQVSLDDFQFRSTVNPSDANLAMLRINLHEKYCDLAVCFAVDPITHRLGVSPILPTPLQRTQIRRYLAQIDWRIWCRTQPSVRHMLGDIEHVYRVSDYCQAFPEVNRKNFLRYKDVFPFIAGLNPTISLFYASSVSLARAHGLFP